MGWNIFYFFARMKEMRKKIILLIIILSIIFFPKKVWAINCSCSYVVKGVGVCDHIGTDPCTSGGANWYCQCPSPVGTSCGIGACVPGAAIGNCQQGEAHSYVRKEDCVAKSNCYTTGVKNMQMEECCCKIETKLIAPLKPTACGDWGIGGNTGIETAVGCFPTEPKGIMTWFLGVGVVVGGAVSFLRMLWGAFLTIMSGGDPEKLKEGQETLVSAIEGILLIIFAVFILRLLGVTILKIPGFG